MGRRSDDDYADIVIDALELGDEEAARMHGMSARNIDRMHDALARGEHVPGSGNVDAAYVRNRKKQRIRDAQLDAQLAVARALEREAKDGKANPQAILALSAALKTGSEIEVANEWMDQQLALVEEQRAKLRARETTADEEEPRQLEAHEKDEQG